jgi:hypothetical protein
MTVTIDGSASVTINSGAVLGINSSTAVASTSGTSIDFTSIPSWVKRITIMLSGVSTNGTSLIQVQIGAGSVVSSGYLGTGGELRAAPDVANFTAGFGLSPTPAAADVIHGVVTIVNITATTWVYSFVGGTSNAPTNLVGGGSSASLSGALDRVRVTTVLGVDTFDAGTINILYE